MLNRTEIRNKINQFAKSSCPFIFIIDFEGQKGFVYEAQEAYSQGIMYTLNDVSNRKAVKTKKPSLKMDFDLPGFESYLQSFKKIQKHLIRGDTYLINLTFQTPISINQKLENIFDIAAARYKLLVRDTFTVFSPETFIKIKNGKIYTFPMKGTIDASIPNAKEIILSDTKEIYEHNTIVDLLRNDLSMVAQNIRVEKFRYTEKIKTHKNELFQISSRISGDLPADFRDHLGDILLTLLPAGSISGAPKARTVDIIRKYENYDRGFYTGVFGYFDGKDLDSAVMIRFIEQEQGQYYYKSGGGITTLSEPEKEYKELINKIYVPLI
jgi:para-aminobenzoate synthetase component I